MLVTLASTTPTVQITSVSGPINLNDTQPTPVPATVTTADQTQFGPRKISISGGVDAQVLTQVSSTEFTGIVQLPQAPFTAKVITATVQCTQASAKKTDPSNANSPVVVPTGTATATVAVQDNTPPSVVVTSPLDDVVMQVDSLGDPGVTITVTGTATDDQTGVASVAWAWDPTTATPTPATLGARTCPTGRWRGRRRYLSTILQ